MVTSSSKKFGMYSPEKFKVGQCEAHGITFLSSQGCVYCRVNVKPDPKR